MRVRMIPGATILLLLATVFSPACSFAPLSAPQEASPKPTEAFVSVPTRLTALALTRPTPTLPPPTATSTPTILPTATPIPTVSSPTATPTPVPEAKTLLEEGLTHQRNGDYARAIYLYRVLLSFRGEEPEAQEARFHLGQAHLLQGDHQSAIEALQSFQRDYPGSNNTPQALFFLAEAHKRQGEYQSALSYYQQYAATGDRIGGRLNLLLAECYVGTGNESRALAEYETASADEGLPLSARLLAMEKLAQIYLSSQDYAQAILWYGEILNLAETVAQEARIEYFTGIAYKLWGKPEPARESFLKVVREYPQGYNAYLALGELLAQGDAGIDPRAQAMIYYHSGDYGSAINSFHTHIERGKDIPQARYYAGLSHQKSGDYVGAIREFDALLRTHPYTETQFVAKGWLEKGKSLTLAGYHDAAISTYVEFANLYPLDALADDALWLSAKVLESQKRYREAADRFASLARSYPYREYGASALFQGGLNYFRTGDYPKAAQIWGELKELPIEPELKAKAFFWLGKTSQLLGKQEEAKAHFSVPKLIQPSGFYGLRARELEGGGERGRALPVPSSYSLDALEERRELEAWLESWAPLSAEIEDELTLEEAIRDDVNFRRGEELLKVGLWYEALFEFGKVRRRFQNDPLALYRLASVFIEMEVYHLSIACAQRILQLSPAASLQEAPELLRKLLYPIFYSNLILPEAKKKGIDPLLFFALVWQESQFNAYATSRSDARGLTQVIPSTGSWIAQKLGRRGFQPAELYRPYLSVEFGTWYLAAQLEAFERQPFYALAAYNGGPGNTGKWAHPDLDLFFENIDLPETRTYIKRIWEHYDLYREIYGE